MEGKNVRVRLYALSTCPVCKRAKNLLESQGVQFDAIDVDTLEGSEQWAVLKEVRRYNPNSTFPTLVIEKVIVGYDEGRIKEALGLP